MARPVVFLDRDGIWNIEADYLHGVEDLERLSEKAHSFQGWAFSPVGECSSAALLREILKDRKTAGHYPAEQYKSAINMATTQERIFG